LADKKIIAVVGATGAQGGGVVRAVLNDRNGDCAVRAITRDPNSTKARELANLGAEVVAANLDDVESLKRAFAGADNAFLVTFFWDHFSAEREQEEVRKMIEAVKHANVKHVIWSTLEDTRKWVPLSDNRMPTLHDKYKVPHFDGKGEADQFFRDASVPTTFLLTSFYWDNFIYFGAGPQKGPDGKLALTFPMGDQKLPGIAAEDIGKSAYGIFKRGTEFIGKTIGIAGEHLTGTQLAKEMSKALGTEINYNSVEPHVYRSFGFPGADDLGNMFQFKRDFNEYFCGVRDIKKTRELNPELQTFEQWLSENAKKIPLGDTAATA
jgi:uncharacterized protein YbjT (DUF2867 family)